MEIQKISALFTDVIKTTTDIKSRLGEEKACTQAIDDDLQNAPNLTDARLRQAKHVLSKIFACKKRDSEVFLVIDKAAAHGSNNMKAVVPIGPVLNPVTRKKDTTMTYMEYCKLRQVYIKDRESPMNTEGLAEPLTEECIIKAVVCYDFLHTNISKPVEIPKSSEDKPDSSFREAVKVLYNRSRVSCILLNFEAGVKTSFYPPLPSLESSDLHLLNHTAECKIIQNYIVRFIPLLDRFATYDPAKVTADLWRFLLFLAQDYSVYYSSVRTLCDEHNRSYATMHARIWMLRVILSIYDTGLLLLGLKPLEYV